MQQQVMIGRRMGMRLQQSIIRIRCFPIDCHPPIEWVIKSFTVAPAEINRQTVKLHTTRPSQLMAIVFAFWRIAREPSPVAIRGDWCWGVRDANCRTHGMWGYICLVKFVCTRAQQRRGEWKADKLAAAINWMQSRETRSVQMGLVNVISKSICNWRGNSSIISRFWYLQWSELDLVPVVSKVIIATDGG